jgi:hypothetical protein
MRAAVALLAVLAGGLSVAFAEPPETPATPKPESTAAQSDNAQDSTGQSSATHTVPGPATAAAVQMPAATPVKPAPSTSAASTSDERMAEQQLRFQGYRPSMVNGEEMYCRREAPLGSRLQSTRHCVTLAEAELMAKEGKETTERLQRNTPGCLMPAQGGCGK